MTLRYDDLDNVNTRRYPILYTCYTMATAIRALRVVFQKLFFSTVTISSMVTSKLISEFGGFFFHDTVRLHRLSSAIIYEYYIYRICEQYLIHTCIILCIRTYDCSARLLGNARLSHATPQ